MLNENQVISFLCTHLENVEGYKIVQRRRTTERGVDLIAEHSSKAGKLRIEAKGGTSARDGSPRSGLHYSSPQVFDRVAKGLYTGIALLCEHRLEGDRTGLAFPDTKAFRKYLVPVMPLLKQLEITVYMVSPEGEVSLL